MQEKITALLLSDIRIPFDAPDEEALKIAEKKVKSARLDARLHFRIYKKSLDARRKSAILKVCSVLCESDEPLRVSAERLQKLGARPFCYAEPALSFGDEELGERPLVVGMGPAGLFAALVLAENGYAPVIIDRGDDVFARARAVEKFAAKGVLDTESNIQFGAGGAGTFSDGKLVTRVNDPLCNYVLSRLVEFGAPAEILQKQKPHVGTDVLRVVVQSVLDRIEALGGTVRYRTKLEDIIPRSQGVCVRTSVGELEAGAVLLAIGHSARDTFEMLLGKGMMIEPKPFSVGVRIEHLREDIDRALYGELAGHPALGPGEYALSDTTGERGVYTFCMCPGGEVVTAASEEGGVVVNGMSYHARDGRNSNAAVAVSVTPADVGGTVRGAIDFQRSIERAAYRAGGGDYFAPVQTVGDFLAGKQGTEPTRIRPTYGGGRVRTADLHKVLPAFVCDTLGRGLVSFDKKLRGYAAPDAVLTGVESRTSSPVRILRGEDGTAPAYPRLYPVGEGAGYAGGITSAALDGLRAALALMARYRRPKEGNV
jgi:uncharacterized FAD-dependent dehydrogenase